MKLESIPGGLAITRRWHFDFAHGVMGASGILLLIAYFITLAAGSTNLLFGLWLIASLVLIYICLTGIFNSTQVTVKQNEIVIRHGPLPWPGKRVVSSEVARIYHRKEKQKNQVNSWFIYAVVVALKNGKELVLDTCDDESGVLFIDFQIEHYLGLSPQVGRN
jgi:hypothetical protein